MAAFVLAKYEFPGGRLFFGLVTTCPMFSGYVTGIPNYLIMSKLGMVDTYWSLILPAFCAPMGLFLMKQFMEGLPTALPRSGLSIENLNALFGYNIYGKNDKPTNGEFIALVADKLLMEEQSKKAG